MLSLGLANHSLQIAGAGKDEHEFWGTFSIGDHRVPRADSWSILAVERITPINLLDVV